MEKLFSYGTLQMESVQKETFGHVLNGVKDSLIGYTLGEIKISDPAVIQVSGTDIHPILNYTGKDTDIVEGTVFELTPLELKQADEYEVEEYVRVAGSYSSGNKAWAYVCAKSQINNI
ncbi:gamma-glutamylcyclotransferase [Pseudoalteromonas sp. SG45-5]|uniref:gamma-glutamylcyclotransferase family protein n=1 Tax=unclassified Pseudoalteromonas TaxID=194690 RepID=UPI0015FDC933|nr:MULTISPECIES: gamma-glutamylcyclotransferase family protein [unclassified Pseudoalteromonas]MBB1385673.1 gamma-glutamylcyclotransferase [Pseudoalteromonas sp. SG45-5]MBB1393564.1 gamma-glutamylcyclotransferase [Pseudoalteromonas sp. SG44-4]MBB1447527.1 gamma-glutamylcyclotransferase [Pseudoalteromonas sp. SG41-6]